MYSNNNTKNILLLVLSAIVILSFSGFIFLIDSNSPTGNIIAQGGNISHVDIQQSLPSVYWSVLTGGFDEFSGSPSIILNSGVIQEINFTSYSYDPSMVVVASDGSFNPLDIIQASPSFIDAYLGIGSTHVESGTNTFNTLYNISIGNSTYELYGTKTISSSGTFISAAFFSSGNLSFVTTTQNASGYNNKSTFFQFMLPVKSSKKYFFKVITNNTCSNTFFINSNLGLNNLSVELNWSSQSHAIKYLVSSASGLNESGNIEFNISNSFNTTNNFFSELPLSPSKFYKVDAVLPVRMCPSSNTIGEYTLELTPSANLISFPLNFTNNSVSEVLRPIMDSFISLNEYNNSAELYNFYIKFMGSIFNNFDTLNLGNAYWLSINNSLNFTMVGSLETKIVNPVFNGSNLVGFPFLEGNSSIPFVLRSIDGNYSTVNVYNNSLKAYDFYIIFGGSVFSNFNVIEPTLGYWIYVNETENIVLP